MALISEYLAADTSPDASADALAIINIGLLKESLITSFIVFHFLELLDHGFYIPTLSNMRKSENRKNHRKRPKKMKK